MCFFVPKSMIRKSVIQNSAARRTRENNRKCQSISDKLQQDAWNYLWISEPIWKSSDLKNSDIVVYLGKKQQKHKTLLIGKIFDEIVYKKTEKYT